MVEVQVEGLKELREALLTTLLPEMQGKALQIALRQAARPMLREARRLAPVATGRMRRAIYITKRRNGTNERQGVIIGVKSGARYKKGGTDAYYWKWVEFGHLSSRTKIARRARAAGTTGARFIPARPFMRPAFEGKKYVAISTFKDKMREAITKASKNAASRAVRRSAAFGQ